MRDAYTIFANADRFGRERRIAVTADLSLGFREQRGIKLRSLDLGFGVKGRPGARIEWLAVIGLGQQLLSGSFGREIELLLAGQLGVDAFSGAGYFTRIYVRAEHHGWREGEGYFRESENDRRLMAGIGASWH